MGGWVVGVAGRMSGGGGGVVHLWRYHAFTAYTQQLHPKLLSRQIFQEEDGTWKGEGGGLKSGEGVLKREQG